MGHALKPRFCHLHIHSEFSLLDGLGKSEQYAKRAAEMGFKYVSCTDHGSIDGLIKHQKACEKFNITPIFGCEGYIVPNMSIKTKGEKRNHITLLVENDIGWQNLLKILTIANLEGYYYKPRFDFKVLSDHLEGLIVLSGCQESILNIGKGVSFFYDLVDASNNNIFL